jgi:hypothetical protein
VSLFDGLYMNIYIRKRMMMAQFDLSKYETVEERHARAIEAHPDLRSVIVNKTTPQDRQNGVWVVEARVYMNAGDQALDLPKAVEVAFEVDGQGMANKTSALENAATSALGRALRWAFAGSKGPSQSEMLKANGKPTARVKPVAVPNGFVERVGNTEQLDDLKTLWAEAVAGGFQDEVQDAVTKRKGELNE